MSGSPKASASGERSSGFYRLLRRAALYNLTRTLFGSSNVRDVLAEDYIGPTSGLRILDIGCGTAELSAWLEGSTYSGFDPNPNYVAQAKTRAGTDAIWLGSIQDARLSEEDEFDVAIAYGVAHHVDDRLAAEMFALAARHLTPNGKLFTVDPCTYPGQPPLARWVVGKDRGRWVRGPEEYARMAATSFRDVTYDVRNDLLRIPYTHLIMRCSGSSR